jgi:hypothetical protein
MTVEITDPPERVLLARLVLDLAHVMPSGTAGVHAAIEWRVLRRAWLDAIEHLGGSEAGVREAAARIKREVLSEVLRDAGPAGSA